MAIQIMAKSCLILMRSDPKKLALWFNYLMAMEFDVIENTW